MHKKYGNSMSSQRKRQNSDLWTPLTAANDRLQKRRRVSIKNKQNQEKENTDPDNGVSAKAKITTRTHRSYSQKAHLIAIFDQMKDSFVWMSLTQLLEKFHERNPSVPSIRC